MKNSDGLQNSSASLKQLFSYANKEDYLMIFLGSLAAAGMGILQPFIFIGAASIYGNMSPTTTTEEYLENATEVCLYMVYGGILLSLFGSLAMSAWIRVGARQGYHFRTKAFKSILKKDCEWFDEHSTAEIAPFLASDSLKVERAAGDKIINFIYPLSTVLTGTALCLYSSVKLTLICIGFGCFIVAGAFLIRGGLELKANFSDSPYVKAAGIAEEALMEIKTVSSLNAQKYQVNKYSSCLKESEKYTIKIGVFIGLGMAIAITSHLFETATLYYIGARGINDEDENWLRGNQVQFTEVQSIIFISMLVCNNLASLFPAVKVVYEGKLAALRLLKIINHQNPVKNGYYKGPINGHIEFQDVSFNYLTRDSVNVLNGLSFELEPSTQLGIVGTTGSGKTTIVQLLLGFYTPNSGQILIDRIPIEDFDRKTLRNSFGLVNQEPFLFDNSILENIRYGDLKASFKDIKEAAYKAGALEFIESLPEEFETIVGPKGSQLSGGQKQRIVIARAILKNPAILILDEATSALDRSTEELVTSAIQEFFPRCTTICIAQNLFTLKNSNNIIVLEAGRVLEEGNHEELIEAKGKYFRLFNMQNSQNVVKIEEENEKIIQITSSNRAGEGEKINIYDNKRQNVKRVLKMSSSQWIYMILAIFGSIVVGGIYPVTGIYEGSLINLLVTERGDDLEEESLDYMIIFYCIGSIFFLGFVLQSYCYPKTSSSVTSRLRKESLLAMLSNDSEFYSQNYPAVLSSRLATDCEIINDIGSTLIGIMGAFLIALIVSIGITMNYSWKIALLFIGLLPIIMFSVGYGLHGSIKGVINFSYPKSNKIASDSLLNTKTIKALALERYIHTEYDRNASDECEKAQKSAVTSGLPYGISLGLMYWYYALIFWFGAKLLDDGQIFYKDLVISHNTGFAASNVFFMLVIFLGDIGGGFLAAKRIFTLLDYKPKIDVRSKSGECNCVFGRIEFQNVSFSYPDRDFLALKNLNFVVEPNTKCAIIGRTGSGKSTIAQLLIRLYDPSQGTISLDYVPLDQFRLKYLREKIGVVIQEPVLFCGSIEENITLGRQFDEKEVLEAINIAQANDFVNKSAFERDVGFKGSSLSGGQKQRIAIARTVIRKPSILVFDEATSALDSETESIVMNNLERALEGSTWIVIAHRIKTVSDADSVLVLESGQALEFGTREELIEREGYFYNISKDVMSFS